MNATDAGLNRDEAEATEEVHTQDDFYNSEQGESGRGSGGGRCVGVSGGEGGLTEEEVGVHRVEEAEAAVCARCEEEGLRMLVGVPLQVGPLYVSVYHYMCPRATAYDCMCPHTTTYYYMCVLILAC